MTVRAYASGDADPLSNPDVQPVIDLSAASLPKDIQLYGAADDSEDGAPTWTWSWTILSKPSGSSAALDSTTAQDPVLQDVDTWGNYLLMLVATNTNSGESSETDPLKVPTEARVIVRVESEETGIEKMAPGERSWHGAAHKWAQTIEDLAAGGVGPGEHTITSHSDVTDATGDDLEAVTSGDYADDPDNPGSPLHKHKGSDIDVASQSTEGTVLLEEAPQDANAPKVITQERLIYQGQASQTIRSSGYQTLILPQDVGAYPNHSKAHLLWYVAEEVEVDSWSVVLLDGGLASTPKPYEFSLYIGTAAQVADNTIFLLDAASILTGTPTSDRAPLVLKSGGGQGWTLSQDTYLALVVEGGDPDNPGAELHATVNCRRLL